MDDGPMTDNNEQLIAELSELIAEEMHLIGLELDDNLKPGDRTRLAELSALLDRASELLARHRAAVRTV